MPTSDKFFNLYICFNFGCLSHKTGVYTINNYQYGLCKNDLINNALCFITYFLNHFPSGRCLKQTYLIVY
jgi:hypothetical protein